MADIKKYTDQISSARYGEEVRGSIVSAITAIHDEVTTDTTSAKAYAEQAQTQAQKTEDIKNSLQTTLTSTTLLAEKVAESESKRIESEESRRLAEFERADAERERANAAKNYVSQAKQAAEDAKRLANSDYALLAKSWAEGNTGIRVGEDEDNAKYWARKVKDIANAGGVVSFNGRGGAVDPAKGDYSADMITYNGTNVGEQLTLNTRSISDLQNIKGVSSFKGRRGEVVPVSGDYTSNQITHNSSNVGAMLEKIMGIIKSPGDNITLNGEDFAGYITSGGTQFYFSIPAPPCLGVSKVKVTKATGRIRQNGKYLFGQPSGPSANLLDESVISSVTFGIHDQILSGCVTFKNAPKDVVNNDVAAIQLSATILLS